MSINRSVSSAAPEVISLNSISAALLDKIALRQAVVTVIGLGYVGLPLAAAFAEAGFRVIGFDVDECRISSLKSGQSYVPDVPAAEILAVLIDSAPNGQYPAAAGGSLYVTTDPAVLDHADAVIVCVPTPVNAAKEPDLTCILASVDAIVAHAHPGLLVVLESTTYPGTTEEVVLPRLEQLGLTVGADVFLAFSPERIDPGRTDWTVRTTPKVVGGVTPVCLRMARALYECVIDRIVPVSNPRTAEMVKLLENTYRAVNIGLANEMAVMCERLNVDVWEVIEAAASKPYGFTPFYPGPGVGGHCIPVDPLYLAWKMRTLNYDTRLIQTAHQINSGMPEHVVDLVAAALNDEGRALKGSRILVLGAAYKANVNDVRESPALEVMHLLRQRHADVAYNDPYLPSISLNGTILTSVELDARLLQHADCVVILTAHACYDWPHIVRNSRLIVDTRNIRYTPDSPGARIVKL